MDNLDELASMFQFQMVRLKVTSKFEKLMSSMFQFQMVRLKDSILLQKLLQYKCFNSKWFD